MEYNSNIEMWTPALDDGGVPDIIAGLPILQKALEEVDQFRTCVQAGGHIGIYPKELANHFTTVYSFEPSNENYECLIKNVSNVFLFNKALTETNKNVGVEKYSPRNTGAWHIIDGSDTEGVTIDSLNLADVDFIQLDVEGYELLVLQGAIKTIKESYPVIMVEDRGHGPKCEEFLYELGYYLALNSPTDKVFKKG